MKRIASKIIEAVATTIFLLLLFAFLKGCQIAERRRNRGQWPFKNSKWSLPFCFALLLLPSCALTIDDCARDVASVVSFPFWYAHDQREHAQAVERLNHE